MFPSHRTIISVNGVSVDLFSLASTISKEEEVVKVGVGVGLTPGQVRGLLSQGLGHDDVLFEFRRGVYWWNDLTRDSRYAYWPKALTGVCFFLIYRFFAPCTLVN